MRAFILTCIACAVALAAGTSVENAKRLEWTDPVGRKPVTRAEWVERRGPELDWAGIGNVSRSGGDVLVALVVHAELYPHIRDEVTQFTADLDAAGYSVQLDTTRTTSHEALRAHLAGVSGRVGAILVGELPVAWYEDGWGSSPMGEEFPIDLYFMDMDGTWTDSDADGLYDGHYGNVAPDIWVGRLYARPLTWDDEVRLMKRYFEKNHAYRNGQLSLPDRALSYVDDDWSYYGDCDLGECYSDVTVVTARSTTTAPDYRQRLEQGYEWIHVCAHSSPWGHTFRDYSSYAGTVFNSELYAIRPHAHFYNLFACSGTRFVEENYSAGWDIFQDDYGLVAVGSGKTGSMLYFDDFYGPLGSGDNIGEAFKDWFVEWGEESRDWFYAMNILGDPTLKPHGNSEVWRGGARAPDVPPQDAEVVGTHSETDDSPRLLCVPGGDVWAIWKSGRNTSNGRFDIYASRRTGGTWSSPYNIGAHEYWDTDPVLGIDGNGRPVAVWSNFTSDYHFNLYYSAWTGSSWSSRQEVSEDCAADMKPSLCRDSTGTLWCFWSSRRDFAAGVWASAYNGSSWSTPELVAEATGDLLYPCGVVMSDGTVWVAYTKYQDGASETWASYRDGSNWVETGPASGNERRALRPAITEGSNGYPVACWQGFDGASGDIRASGFDGGNWSAPVAVCDSNSLDVLPAMATDEEGRPWVAWMSDRAGNWDVYYSHPAGADWLPAQAASTSPGADMNPAIAAGNDGSMWLAWQNLSSGNWDVYACSVPTTGLSEGGGYASAGLRVAPNPFRRVVTVSGLGSSREVTVLDAAGRRLRTLEVRSGRASWDGRDRDGRAVRPGVYFLRAGGGGFERVTLVR